MCLADQSSPLRTGQECGRVAPGRKTRNPHQNSELLRNVAGIVAVNLVLAASQDSAIDNLGAPLRRSGRGIARGCCSGR